MSKQSYPEPTVGALIFNPENRLLLVRSHKWRNNYTIPGGHVELGESIEDALTREVKEETGLDIHDMEFVDFQEFIFDDAFWEKRHFIFFDYACKTDSMNIKLNSESEAYVWVSLEDVFNLPIDLYTKQAIQTYLAKHAA